MIQHNKRTVLITGASSGIGLELARVFAAHNYDLVLVARNEARLHEVAHELKTRHRCEVRVLASDLSQSTAPLAIYDQLQRDRIHVDVLVNNAGFSTYGAFTVTDLKTELEMLQVNIVALTHLTKLFMPAMLQQRRGRILNVASTAAFQPGPLMAVYYASKAYVLSFSQAVGEELRGSGVTVTALCPGPTASSFQQRAAMQKSKLMSGIMMDARTVAVEGYRGLMRSQPVVIPGRHNRFFALLSKLLPGKAVLQIVKRAQEPNDAD
jgi:short-subunit dehydrogenase